MNEFIEKNRRLLHFYCETLRTIGSVILILVFLGGFATAIFALLSEFGYWHTPKSFNMNMIARLPSFLGGIVFWIGIIGLAQFIKYLFERNYKPGWILRHGNKILYLYAATLVVEAIIRFCFLTVIRNASDFPIHFYLLHWLPDVSKGLILVGLGQILRRLMPVIEESKTLV